jgi:hypothetical protein
VTGLVFLLLVLAALMALGRGHRRGSERSKSGLELLLEADGRARDEAHERTLDWARRREEEAWWKSDC